jgi:hypothetical protein
LTSKDISAQLPCDELYETYCGQLIFRSGGSIFLHFQAIAYFSAGSSGSKSPGRSTVIASMMSASSFPALPIASSHDLGVCDLGVFSVRYLSAQYYSTPESARLMLRAAMEIL